MNEQVTTEKLFEDLKAVVHDTEALLKATANMAGEKIQEVRTRAEETLKEARSNFASMEENALVRAKEIASDADSYVHQNPWQAVGIAAGVGLLAGLLISRR